METSRILCVALLLPLFSFPSPAAGQANGFGYLFDAGGPLGHVSPPTSLSGLGLSDDGQATVALPWGFDWYGITYNAVTVYANGGFSFTPGSLAATSTCLPAPAGADVLVYWDDLDPSSGGDVYTWVDGSGPAARFIISWEDVPHSQGAVGFSGTFQAQLAADGSIELHYVDTDFGALILNHGADAVIGIQDVSGSGGLDVIEASCDSPQLLQGSSSSIMICGDADGDGYLDAACGGQDCADGDASISPAAPELCDGLDTDCDGLADVFDLDVGGQTGISQSAASSSGGWLQYGGPPTVSAILVSAPGLTVQDLDVLVAITYDPTGDLVLELTSPSGTLVTLASRVGLYYFNSPSFTGTTFDDEAVVPISVGAAPYTGSYIPDGALSNFDLEPADGVWTLTVTAVGFFSVHSGQLNNWGLDLTLQQGDDADMDGAVDSCGDCDATDASVYPGAPEICLDGVDQDCDGVDFLGDLDGDGYVDINCGGNDCDDADPGLNPGVDLDGDGSDACADCDDSDPSFYPGAMEICGDGLDQDCSGADDLGDEDGDGYLSLALCIGGDDCDDSVGVIFPGSYDLDGDGYSICEDCFELGGDSEPLMNPGALEVCGDGVDNDCDGGVDDVDADGDGFITDLCSGGNDCDDSDAQVHPQADGDGDGFGACTDCDDTEPTVFPGATEVCDDGLDQSCTGADRLGDLDGDGFSSLVCGGGDCDDDDPNLNPAAEEICDGIELNCDGVTISTDEDSDGFYDADCGGDDCDDSSEWVHPQADELCDGLDNDCDGALLDGGELDEDGDGARGCGDDCDDQDAGIYPGAEELCDGVDNDCDGDVDEGLIRDGDGDGYDRPGCGGDDCDDGRGDVFPGRAENCSDDIDNDCDGAVDTSDADCDPVQEGGCACTASALSSPPLGFLVGLIIVLGRWRRRVTPGATT